MEEGFSVYGSVPYEFSGSSLACSETSLPVEKKHMNTFNVLNCVGVIITTNYKTGGIYLPEDDRHHYMAWSEMKREDFDPQYWSTLWGWYETGGYGHVAAYHYSCRFLKWAR
jgi:hypothetical protein